MLLGFLAWQDDLCPNGHYMPESGAPENEGRYAITAHRCHVCTAIAVASDTTYKDSPNRQALLFGARLKKG